MPDTVSFAPAARLRLEDAILLEIDRLADALWGLGRVDREVFGVGVDTHGSEVALALWLVQPAMALGSRMPLSALAAAEGRKEVLGLLGALADAGKF
jgi:hypothetical protein